MKDRVSIDMQDGVPEWRLLRTKHVPTTGLDDNVHFLPARSEAGREAELREWTATAHALGSLPPRFLLMTPRVSPAS